MEEVSNGLTTTTGTEQPQPPPPLLHLIVISGASGTGKSTLAYEVCWRLRNGVDFCYDAQGSGGEDRYGDVEGLIEEGEGGGEGVDGGGGGGGGCGEYYDEKKTKKLMHAHIDADNLDALYPLPADHDSGLMLSVLGVQWQVFLEVFARVLWYPEMGYQVSFLPFPSSVRVTEIGTACCLPYVTYIIDTAARTHRQTTKMVSCSGRVKQSSSSAVRDCLKTCSGLLLLLAEDYRGSRCFKTAAKKIPRRRVLSANSPS